MTARISIIGAGVAGVAAATELRDQGYAGEIWLFNEEPELPYDRPPLSKAFAAGEATEDDIRLHPPSWYEEHGITHLQGVQVTAIDPTAHLVHVDGGSHGYDKLLLATGAKARCLPGLDPGHHNCLLLRSAADARRLRARMVQGTNIILVGGGVIGMECAATAARAGCNVTVLEGFGQVMARFLAPAVAAHVTTRHRAEGVRVLTDFSVAKITTQDHGVTITSADGRIVAGDLVLVGIGAAPDVTLAQRAGLDIQAGGIAVDACGRTSAPDIYAAGDCASFPGAKGEHVRLENWTHAVRHAQAAARSMMGQAPLDAGVPWVWSDQFDMNIQVTGVPYAAELVLRGSLESGRFTAIHIDGEGVIVGATSVNHGRDKRMFEKLIAASAVIPRDILADEKIPLKSLLPALAN